MVFSLFSSGFVPFVPDVFPAEDMLPLFDELTLLDEEPPDSSGVYSDIAALRLFGVYEFPTNFLSSSFVF